MNASQNWLEFRHDPNTNADHVLLVAPGHVVVEALPVTEQLLVRFCDCSVHAANWAPTSTTNANGLGKASDAFGVMLARRSGYRLEEIGGNEPRPTWSATVEAWFGGEPAEPADPAAPRGVAPDAMVVVTEIVRNAVAGSGRRQSFADGKRTLAGVSVDAETVRLAHSVLSRAYPGSPLLAQAEL